MLSRTADHLFWMSRYTERAENIARMLDVNYRMSLMPHSDLHDAGWSATLSITGLSPLFQERHSCPTPESVLHFMVFDPANPSSIYSCLRAARENAHAVRGTLTSEMWEILNATWLEMRDYPPSRLTGSEIGSFFEWVKFRSHLTRGVTLGTFMQDDAFHFIRLGTFLERADNTARFLDVKYEMLELSGRAPDAAADYYQWSALLRSVSAFEVYRRVYRDLISPVLVAELLVLCVQMPRSLSYCMREVHSNLCAVRNGRSAETERRAGELESALRFGRIGDIFDAGLHDWLTDFIGRIHDLGNRMSEDFLVPVSA